MMRELPATSQRRVLLLLSMSLDMKQEQPSLMYRKQTSFGLMKRTS